MVGSPMANSSNPGQGIVAFLMVIRSFTAFRDQLPTDHLSANRRIQRGM
jgi:hypothetical protein